MTSLVVATSEGVYLRRDIAGAGSRLAAALIDASILIGLYCLTLLTIAVASQADATGVSRFLAGVLIGGVLLSAVAYQALWPMAWSGRTPGKAAVGLRIVSADGYPATSLQLVLRALVWPLDLFPIVPASIGLISIAATARHQRLGDLVAGTLVVRADVAASTIEPWPGETWTGLADKRLALTPGMAARLAPHDVAFLRDLITRPGLDGEARRQLFVRSAVHYAERLGLGAFDDARVVLREVYLFARETRSTPPA
ncbi:MAG: RDD family protein [Planctomycetota bacterium]